MKPADEIRTKDISGRDLLRVLAAGRWIIISTVVLTTLCAAVADHVVDKKYIAAVIVSPVSGSNSNNQMGALSSLTSQFGGLASLAGLSVTGDTKKFESLAVLQSEALTERFITENKLLPVLYADRWDAAANKWKIQDHANQPTVWKANRLFKNIRVVATDIKTGLATLTITWKDPQLAANWANDLVRMSNDYLREQAIQESAAHIAYLQEQALKTDAVGLKQAIYSLIQNEISKEMLARGNADYALKVIDPAVAPEIPASPKLAVWLPIGFLGGLFLSIFFVFARDTWKSADS